MKASNDGAGLEGEVWVVEVAHTYTMLSGFFSTEEQKRHDCLRYGWWCWLNVREHPLDIIKYFRKKLK